MKNPPEHSPEGIPVRSSPSAGMRLTLIGLCIVILLIPLIMVQKLVDERQMRHEEAVQEITAKWAKAQIIGGPVLVVPYLYEDRKISPEGTVTVSTRTTHLYLLPETLNVSGHIKSEIRKRHIFEAVVYNAKLEVSGRFGDIELWKSGVKEEHIQWDKARIVIGLSDLKGLKTNPEVTYGAHTYPAETDFYNSSLFPNSLIIVPDFKETKETAHNFHLELDLRGSNTLAVMPLGQQTTITLSGDWADPKFDGSLLPETREVNEEGFRADWSIPYFNREQPRQWLADNTQLKMDVTNLLGEHPGVELLLPVDNYQKTTRSVKYGLLILVLTFTALFFTEMLIRKRVFLVQYLLIGAALIIYYSLLLSFSELIGFNAAYAIASVATILLISAFTGAILKNRQTTLLFAMILSVFYLFIFVLMQLQNLSLLFGSIGLFLVVALLMYFSNKVNWDRT